MSSEKSPSKTSETSFYRESVTPEKVVDEKTSPTEYVSALPVELDHQLSKRITRKIDLRLCPILGLMYLIAFLDRTNIANAKLNGFEKDLNMPSNGYNTALWVFFLSFVLLEVPSNLLLSWQKIRPNHWLAAMMFFLGVVTMCQGLTKSAGGLYACRFIMGIFEGGVAPGAALLMGQYYRRQEFAPRYAFFVCSALLGSAFSSFLAYAIGYMNGVAGYQGWRWIFILEGLISVIFSVAAFFVIPGFPRESAFLTEEEREYLLQRLEAERGNEKITIHTIKWGKILFDWKVWLATLIYFCADMGAASIVSFSPTILSQLGWNASDAQIHNIPIFLVGIVIAMTCAFLTSRTHIRFPFILLGVCIALVGWSIQLSQVNPPGVRYFGLFMIAAGAYIQMPMMVVWLNNNLHGRSEKAVAAAIQLGFGNSCNFISSNVFITGEAPRYKTGFLTGLVLTVVGGITTVVFTSLLWKENRKADAREAEGRAVGGEGEGVVAVLGEAEGVRFRYTL